MYKILTKNRFIEQVAPHFKSVNATALFDHLQEIHNGCYVIDLAELATVYEEATLDELAACDPVHFEGLTDACDILKALKKRTTVIANDGFLYLVERF